MAVLQYFYKPIESDRETDSMKSQQPKIVLGANFRKAFENKATCFVRTEQPKTQSEAICLCAFAVTVQSVVAEQVCQATKCGASTTMRRGYLRQSLRLKKFALSARRVACVCKTLKDGTASFWHVS